MSQSSPLLKPADCRFVPGVDDLIFQSDRTRVYRNRAPGGALIVYKERFGADAQRRTHNEWRILDRLAGIDGVPQLAGPTAAASIIALQDRGGIALSRLIGDPGWQPIALADFAHRLASLVADMHRRGIVHKDINPANILLTGRDRRPNLIDFDLATTFAEDRPGFIHHSAIAGTLAYMAPEQTGRTGLTMDYRADLYSLGVTLYELATGHRPFASDDPLVLIHDHLARVPTPPSEVNPRLPQPMSDIIMRLLEKEPERRYQSAEGLAHDLKVLLAQLSRGEAGPMQLGAYDFPLRLSPSSRLAGRSAEIAALGDAFERALAGKGQGLLVAGAAGVGKSALIDQLRPVVTLRYGWFVAGKFEQFGRNTGAGAVTQVMRALGRMLLAEPDEVLAIERQEILDLLGSHAGRITAALPEFALLLGNVPPPPSTDPSETEAQLRVATLALLRAIVSPERPVVMALDDLQWADPGTIRLIEAAMTDSSLRGLLIVGSYRDAEVDAAHPLAGMLDRLRPSSGLPPVLKLSNLAPADLGSMVGEMLKLAPAKAARLAAALAARTAGNPFDTTELINALRRDGVLAPGPKGWTWNEAAIRRHIGSGEVIELLTARIAKLPGPARELLQMIACLGCDVDLGLLRAASGLSPVALEDGSLPSIEDGLLLVNSGEGAGVRFRHDRVQQAAHADLTPQRRSALHLAIARRLMLDPDYRAKAAEQYLSAIDALDQADEQHRVALLFYEIGQQANSIGNHLAAERYLAAAMLLLDRTAVAADDPMRLTIEVARHAALCGLGRHTEVDEIYRSIQRRCTDPLDLVNAASIQLNSLCNRGQLAEGVAFGVALLGRLGLHVPGDLGADIRQRLQRLSASVKDGRLANDLQRTGIDDKRAVLTGKLLVHTAYAAYLCDRQLSVWMLLEGAQRWVEQGPCAPLMSFLGSSPVAFITLAKDYRTGYDLARHAIAMGEARRYEPETSYARAEMGFHGAHWFEPLENSIEHAQRAREGLLQAGDLQAAAITYNIKLLALLDCASTLDEFDAEVEAACAFATRTGHQRAILSYVPSRQLSRALRGETEATGSLSDASFDVTANIAGLSGNLPTLAAFHTILALTAALFRDQAGLARHSAEGMRLLLNLGGMYRTVSLHLMRALALAEQIRNTDKAERAALLAELDACRDWFVGRAADAPMNYLHLLRFVEAERAWALDALWEAASGFEMALKEAQHRRRPWHQALIAERAGLFHLAQGLDRSAARGLLAESRRLYANWGATGKVRQLEEAHGFLRDNPTGAREGVGQTAHILSEAIDLVAVLRASQALSSETNLEKLRARVVEVLGSMTGATGVTVAIWHGEPAGWHLPDAADGASILSLEAAAARRLLPISAARYADRTREPLLVDDATQDPRFAGDPYFAQLGCCSLLAVPILSHGAPRALLLLENRLARGAFTTDRLEAVSLIAGQLAVSFDNALLYASLEHRVTERTAELVEANRRLESLSLTDALTGTANRRRFDEVLEGEWRRARRQRGSLALAILDVDHFKLYNDRYGHLAGDACLKRVATALESSLRKGIDLVARYGGEEFAIIAPGTDLEAVRIVAERARARVEALGEPHLDAQRGIVTVSIGIAAVVPSEGTSTKWLIETADAALYRAKRMGRNQVQAEHESPDLAPGTGPADEHRAETEHH